MCHFSDQNKKDNVERMMVRKKKLPFRATFSQGYEKKYNNSNNGKLDNNIDRYDDNENDNYDNNSNKSRFQVKSAGFTRFCLYSKYCDWNYEVSVQLSSLS